MRSTRFICLVVTLFAAWVGVSNAATRDAALTSFPEGSIVIKTGEHRLYLLAGNGETLAYPIAVGREGLKWVGETVVARKVKAPVWEPPAAVRRDHPQLPLRIPAGHPKNPLGEAVLVLGDGTYGIHGTNKNYTIGTDASYGCFRMFNSDVLDLFDRVQTGIPVYVLP